MSFKCKLLLVALFALPVFGSNKVGNGGDVILCQAAEKETAELLDFYESKTVFKTEDTDPYLIAEKQLSKWKKSAPRLAEQYIRRLKEISKEIDFRSEIQLTDIKDSDHLFKPASKDCKVQQIAIRDAKALASEKRFLIRKDLWDKLSPWHQAGLLTHEIIYEHLAKLGEENSRKARRLNSLLFDDEPKKTDLWKLIQELRLPIYP